MKFIIPYREKRDNPDAGRTHYRYPIGPIECEIRSKKPIKEYENSRDVRLVIYDGNLEYPYVYMGYNLEEIPLCDDFIFNRTQNYETFYTLTPAPKYLYKYGDDEVSCDICGESFSWRELESKDVEYGDEYYYSDRVCPKCESWDCCEIEFQK